ncbi:MAG: thiamine pyrophosphate-binding protein [Candidatus Methanomethyliaceae archaeon]|nr:thiamine pyrophosphate-binding protein [Candidatus Methanomethyliaceae archaeon]
MDDSLKTVDVVVRALERLGFFVAFGIPGMWSIPLYNALSESKIKHVLMRHEQNAVYAADGYARASGKVGLCISTAGPGAVNLAAGIAVPFKDHSPVLAITGQVPTYERGKDWIEDLDLEAIFSPITKFATQVSDPSEAYDVMCRAYYYCLEGCPGPSYVGLPGDIQKKISKDKGYVPTPPRTEPDPLVLEIVAGMINEANSPLIISGWGAILSNASDLVIRLAERIGAPVVTSMMGRGVLPEDHPLSLGPVGRRGYPVANDALSSCDLLISLGCRLTNLTLYDIKLSCKIIQVDVEDKNFSALSSIKVKSDVSLFIEAILPKIKPRPYRQVIKPKGSQLSHSIALNFAKAITKFSDATFTLDIGQHTIWIMQAINVRRPRQIIFSGNLSAMGYSLPASIGVKIANPQGKVIAVMGDGGFQMSSSELSTIKENCLGIAVCVFNNRSLGLIRQIQEVAYNKPYGVEYTAPPDYLKLADAYGIEGIRASNPDDVKKAIENLREPILIEIPIPANESVELTKPRILKD